MLWIGYLQWHFRTRKDATPPLPVLKDFRTIECRDAVLDYDGVDFVVDEHGKPVTRWDGRSFKKHPVTGEDVPDEAAQTPQERYLNPRKAVWPEAEFVVGNPPYLGARTIRGALGDGYLQALRDTYPEVPEHADFVMYWWGRAATMLSSGQLRAFGLITTNSIRQEFSRKILDAHLGAKSPISLRFVIPDHPWVDSSDGAAVRVALTVASAGKSDGSLHLVTTEKPGAEGEVLVDMQRTTGCITSSLNIGFDVSALSDLRANSRLSCVGYQLTGTGFVVSHEEAIQLDPNVGTPSSKIWPLYSGRDLTQRTRSQYAIDVSELTEAELLSSYARIFQHLHDRLKVARTMNRDSASAGYWWKYARPRFEFRPGLKNLTRIIATSLTAKFRTFQFVEPRAICDSTTVMFAFADAPILGLLSSRTHVVWALAAGARLGVGNDARYTKGSCFETFPFPNLSPEASTRIGELAEAIDRHRKQQQAAHADLTLTGCYNVLEALSQQRPLTAKEKVIHEQGLVSVLASLHDDLDREVLAAYGWGDLAPDLVGKPGGTTPFAEPDEAQAAAQAELLNRLVALNTERAAEEARGHIRWLRPEFQNPQGGTANTQIEADMDVEDDSPAPVVAPVKRQPWPADLPAQVRSVADVLAAARVPLSLEAIAACFTGKGPWKKRLPQILDTLEALGRIKPEGAGYRAV